MTVGAIIRVLYILIYPVPVRDSFVYKTFIESWNQTGVFPQEPLFPPLGITLLKISSTCFDCETIKGGRITNTVLGICIIYIMVRISLEISKSRTIALVIGLLSATHPTLISYSCQMTRENPYLFFCSMTCMLLVMYSNKNKLYFVLLLALSSSAAFLCRHEGLELIPIVIVVICMCVRNVSKKAVFLRCVLFLASYVISFLLSTYLTGVPISHYKLYNKRYLEYWTQQEDM